MAAHTENTEPRLSPIHLKVNTWGDFLRIGAELERQGLCGHKHFCTLIGGSKWSPMQRDVVPRAVEAIIQNITRPHSIQVLWTGGDAFHQDQQSSATVTDLAYEVYHSGGVRRIGAYHLSTHHEDVPHQFDVRVSFPESMAYTEDSKERRVYGGWRDTLFPGMAEHLLIPAREDATMCHHWLPRPTMCPVSGTKGYMSILPCLMKAQDLILVVVPRAGSTTLREVQYSHHLMSALAQERGETGRDLPLHVYYLMWDTVQHNVRTSCKVKEILGELEQMKKKWPDNVHKVQF